MICHACSREVKLFGLVRRSDSCNECKADLHCCRNCKFFDTGMRHECREPIAEPVRDKAAANYCDHFQPNAKVALTTTSRTKTASSDAKDAFRNLFNKKK